MRRHHAAAAAAQRQVVARVARLARRLLPATERAERAVALPVLAERVDARLDGRREAARRQHPRRLGPDEQVAARAAVDGEPLHQLRLDPVVRHHRRVRAIEPHAHPMLARQLQHRRYQRAMLLVGAAQRLVGLDAAPRRLEPQKLHLPQLARAGIGEDAAEPVEAVARDDAVDADVLRRPPERHHGAIGAREPIESAHARVVLADAVDRHVDLPEQGRPFAQPRQHVVVVQARRRQVRHQAPLARMPRHVAQPRQQRRFAATERQVEDAALRQLVDRPLPLLEAPFAGGARRRGAGIAALAAGVAAVGQLQVRLQRRRQRLRVPGVIDWLLIHPQRRRAIPQPSRPVAVDEYQRPRPRQVDDAAEALVAKSIRCAPDHRDLAYHR